MSVPPKIQLQQLVLLQKLDDEISRHRKLLAEIPAQIDSECAELEDKKKILSIAIEEINSLQKNRKAIESEVQIENDHMAKAKIKLPAVKTNKEYTAILVEVDAVKEKIARLEDKELDIMEVLEEKQNGLPIIEKKCKEEDIHFQQYKAKKEGELDRMTKEMDPLIAKRESVTSQIDKVMLQRYEKVAKSRSGQAVVSLQENICQGCFQQILPQMVIDVKVGESIHQCSSCLCFLYWKEVTEAVTPK
jgi:uncharacterized protein